MSISTKFFHSPALIGLALVLLSPALHIRAAWQRLPGSNGGLFSDQVFISGWAQFEGSLTIDATGEKAAYCGPVVNKDGGSKDITKIGFAFGAVTKTGGSDLTFSLQNANTASGSSLLPDGTKDQEVDVLDSAVTANTFVISGALSGNRTVAYGELVCAVMEFNSGGRTSPDSYRIHGIASTEFSSTTASFYNGSSWSSWAHHANVLFEFTDGSFGTVATGFPLYTLNQHAYNVDSTPDEYARRIRFPFPVKIDAALVYLDCQGANHDIVMYEGTSAMSNGTVSIDGNTCAQGGVLNAIWPFAADLALTKNTDYYLSAKPTTTSNIRAFSVDVASSNHLQAHVGGVNWTYNTRTNGGSWSETTTRTMLAWGVRVVAFDDGAGSGSGGGAYVFTSKLFRPGWPGTPFWWGI